MLSNEIDESYANQFVRSSIIDLLDEPAIKTLNQQIQNFAEEAVERSALIVFLITSLGKNATVDTSDEGIAKMVEQYKKLLEEGKLKSNEYVTVLNLNDFNKYLEELKKIKKCMQKNEKYLTLYYKR